MALQNEEKHDEQVKIKLKKLELGENLEKSVQGPRLYCIGCNGQSVNTWCFICVWCEETEEEIFCRGCGAVICWAENEVCILYKSRQG